MIIDLWFYSVQNNFETMLCKFIMTKVRPEMESLRKFGIKTLKLAILVYLMMIKIVTALLGEGGGYSKDNRPMIDFSSKLV